MSTEEHLPDHKADPFCGCICECPACARDDDNEPEGYVCVCPLCPPDGCADCLAAGVRHEHPNTKAEFTERGF